MLCRSVEYKLGLWHFLVREVTVSDFDFEQAATDIIDEVRNRPRRGGNSVWESMVAGFAKQGACDMGIVNIVEEVIHAHLSRMRAPQLRSLWAGCESGFADSDAEFVPNSELRRFLEPELLARITEIAGEDARRRDRQPRPNKPQQRTAPSRRR